MSTPAPGDGGPPFDPESLRCTSFECATALAAVAQARGVIIFKCGQVASARSWMNTLAAIAATLFGLAIAAFAAAAAALNIVIVGIVLAKLLFWIGITLLATAILFAILAGIAAIRVLVLEGELNQARVNFADAVTRVTTSCPSTCWGDLTMPSC
jgi:hypothetical protein